MKASLKEFIQNGSLGSLQVGDSRATVLSNLGAPHLWHANATNFQNADIWKYGDVEFYFQNDALWMIFMDDFIVPTGGATLELDPWIISGQLACADAEKHLRASAISYRREDFPFCDNGVRLITAAGTTLTFSSEESLSPTLCAIHREKQILGQDDTT